MNRFHRPSLPGAKRGALQRLSARTRVQAIRQVAVRLHDDLGPLLTLGRLELAALRAGESAAANALAGLDTLLRQAAAAVRALTFELHAAPSPGSWQDALAALATDLSTRYGLAVRLDAPDTPAPRLRERQREVVLRVVRELCLNARKHGRAREVRVVVLWRDGALRVRVHDDGPGLPVPAPVDWRVTPEGGFGLASAQAQLRALGGELTLASEPGRGACANITVPLVAEAA